MMPSPESSTTRHAVAASSSRRTESLIVSPGPVCWTAFSTRASTASSRRSRSASTVTASSCPVVQTRRAVGRHRHSASVRKLSRATGARERNSGSCDAAISSRRSLRLFEPRQLAEHHVDVLLFALTRELRRQQLGVAQGDRDRRSELVRGILEEPALARQQLAGLLARPALRVPRVPGGSGGSVPVRVPHHDQAEDQNDAEPDGAEDGAVRPGEGHQGGEPEQPEQAEQPERAERHPRGAGPAHRHAGASAARTQAGNPHRAPS